MLLQLLYSCNLEKSFERPLLIPLDQEDLKRSIDVSDFYGFYYFMWHQPVNRLKRLLHILMTYVCFVCHCSNFFIVYYHRLRSCITRTEKPRIYFMINYTIPIYQLPSANIVENVLIANANGANSDKIAIKLHRQFAHPTSDKLIALLKEAGRDTP